MTFEVYLRRSESPDQFMIAFIMHGKRLLHFLIWLVLAVGIAVAVGMILLFYRGGTVPSAWREAQTPAQVQATEESIRSLRQEVERVAEAVRNHRSTPFTWRVRDEELNTYFATHPEELRALNPDLRWVEVEFGTGGAVSFRGLGTYRGREILLRVKGRLSLDTGQGPHFLVQEGHLGVLPLPAGLRKKLAAEINQGLSQKMKNLSPQVRLESLSSTEGELILQGQVVAGAR